VEPIPRCVGAAAPPVVRELVVFEHLSHAGLHEDPETFNRATLDFLLRQPS
jgi:pimeloyl-ACP methyl ester carboxylesterase